MSDEKPVLYAIEGAVALVTLNRPEKRNALNDALVAGLKEALRDADGREDVRAVVVTGAAGGPSLVDLGPSAKINGAVAAWRDRVLSGKEAAAEWAALATLLWKPLGEALPRGREKYG
jgi:1,4-dihydroxy-2-naphthoyl-CoA synthase